MQESKRFFQSKTIVASGAGVVVALLNITFILLSEMDILSMSEEKIEMLIGFSTMAITSIIAIIGRKSATKEIQ